MKQRDLTVIITVAVVAGIFSYLISSLIFGGQKAYNLKAPKVQPVTSDFSVPDTKYFNNYSINITKDITIGDSSNPDPLKNL